MQQQHTLGGVRSGTLGGPLVIVPYVPPQLTRTVTPSTSGTQVEALVTSVPIMPRVIGADGTSTGLLVLLANGVEVARQAIGYVANEATTAQTRQDWVEIVGQSIDIKPLRELMSVYTLRQSGTFASAPVATRLPNWTEIPTDAETLTVLVHGFNVDEESATKEFFPTYFRRLYWTGHPVLGPQRGAPHVIGLSWPGNQTPTLGRVRDLLALFGAPYFPEDEFHAFQSGKVLADLLVAEGASSGPISGRRGS